MVNNDTGPMDESLPMTEFYVPATFQFSREPGRIERVLVGLFDEDGEIEARRVTEEPMPEFYVPAMFQLSTDPGRLERFLQALFKDGDERGPMEFPEDFRDDFYLPAVNPDGYKRPREQKPGQLVPASEVSWENGKT